MLQLSLLTYQLRIDNETLALLIFHENFMDYHKEAVDKNTIHTTFIWDACLKDADVFNTEEIAEILTYILKYSDMQKLANLRDPEKIVSEVFPDYEP